MRKRSPFLGRLIGTIAVGMMAGLVYAPIWAAEGIPIAVSNGGFEAGEAGWEGSGEVVGSEHRGGVRALALASGFELQSMSDVLLLEPDADYQLRLWIKCNDCNDNGVLVNALLRGAPLGPNSPVLGWVEGSDPQYILDGGKSPSLLSTSGTHDWTQYVLNIPARQFPAAARALQLYLRHDGGGTPTGTAYFDDVAMMRFPVGTFAAASVIANGGFQNGKAPWWGAGELVRDETAEGQVALKLPEGFVAQDKRPVQGGKHYRLTMKIRSDAAPAGSVFVQLSYRGDGVNPGWRGQERVSLATGVEPAVFVTGGDHGWTQFSVVVEAPPGAKEAVLYLRKKEKSPGSAYYDAVEMTPTTEAVLTMAEVQRIALAKNLLQPPLSAAAAKAALDEAVRTSNASSPAFLTLADNGQARYRIHVSDKADIITLHAAGELADYMQRISGANLLPLSNDASTQPGPLLIIGRDNALVQRLGADIPYDKLGNDGFAIRTVGPHVLIVGATPRGTMYGVNWFMDRKLGVKWLSPTYTYVPSVKTLNIARLDEQQMPRFAYREVLSFEGQDKLYRAHNLLNGESHGPSFSPSPAQIDSWEHSWLAKDGYANFYDLLPQKTYGADHPEWYAGGQLAMMDPLMRRTMADAIVTRLKALPDYKSIWFDIHDMDWGWDMDPASAAFAGRHGGSPAAPRLDMVIDVANQVRKLLPDAKFAFNAYHWSFTPPQGMTVPDYVLVFPMTIQVDYSSALNKGNNEKLGQDLAGWNAIARNMFVWDHITNFGGFYQPTPNIYPIGRSIQWLASMPSVSGYFAEGSWNTPAAEFASLRVWMISRLLWDPEEDVGALIAEYCTYYFGPAGKLIYRYIDLMHAAIAKSGDVLGEKSQVDLAMFDLDFVTAADTLFDQAEAAAAANPLMLDHVQEARIPLDYVILVRRKEYADEAARRGAAWQVDAANRLARFNRIARARKFLQYRQSGGMPELAELFAVERRTADVPEIVRNLPATAWRVFQDISVNRYDSARIVQDGMASDAAAARMNGDSSTWAVQFKLDKLPKEGQWELYADVRVDAEAGHTQEDGLRVGAYPPMGSFTAVSVGALSDGHYHPIKIPGGPFHYDPDQGKGVYVQAVSQKYLKYVYVDRLIAVQVGQ